MKCLPFDARLVALAAVTLLAAGCARDACNNECAPGEICDETLLACVPDDSTSDGGPTVSCTADDQCNVARPHCAADRGICVQCEVNGDCPTGRCDPFNFTCLPQGCSSTADCTTEMGRPFCAADGSCVECRTSSDCPSTGGQRFTCDLGSRQCVTNPCRQDADCGTDLNGRVCEVDSGRCVACVRDEQCALGACRTETNTCVDCLDDADCQTSLGETCNTETFACEVTGCANDASCEGAGRCDLETRDCVACLGDDDCAFGGECSEAAACAEPEVCVADSDCLWPGVCVGSACVQCRDDAGCAAGQTCVEGACVEPATCTTSAECGPGRSCQGGACADADCTADAFEPNDTAGAAFAVDPGHVEAVLCPNESDLYALRMQEGAGLEAVVTWDPADGTPELELVAGLGGPVLVTSSRVAAPGKLVATIERAGQGTDAVLVRVAGGAGRRIPYTLDTTVEATGLCADDGREIDNAQSSASLTIPGVFDGVVCPSGVGEIEQDWFAVDVAVDHVLQATLTVDGAAASQQDVNVEVHRMHDGRLVREAYGFDEVKSTSVAGLGGDRYWLVVRNLSPRKHAYELRIETPPQPPANDACAEDLSTLPLLTGSVEGHTLGAVDDGQVSCGGTGGDAFWRLELAEPSSVRLVSTGAFESVLAVQSACEPASELACASGNALSDELIFDGLPAGTYVVRVDGEAGQMGSYTLLREVTPAAAPPVGESCATTTPLAFTEDVATVSGNLALSANDVTAACGVDGGDAVWAFTLEEPRRLRALLDGFPGASVSLVSATGCGVDPVDACAAASSVQSGTLLERFAVPAGDWLLVVDGGNARTGLFSLRVELSEALYPPVNDACEAAAGLGETPVSADSRGAVNDFTPVCGAATHSAGDAVWRLTVVGEEEVELSLDAEFDASLSVTAGPCGTGETLACADGPRANLILPALTTGEYYVWVDGYAAEEGRFTLTSTKRPAAPVPGNDLCAAAEAIDPAAAPVERTGSTRRATDDLHPNACAPNGSPMSLGGPDLAYRVTVPAGRTLQSTLTPTDFDGALYVLDACDQNACLAGSDSFVPGDVERVSVTNDGVESVDYIVVVDSYRSTATGAFTVRFALAAE